MFTSVHALPAFIHTEKILAFPMVTPARCSPCCRIGHSVLMFALSVVSWLIRLRCHFNCYHAEAMSGWTLPDLLSLWPLCPSQQQSSQWYSNPLSFLLFHGSQSPFLLLLLLWPHVKDGSNRLVHTATCVHITSHAIPSQHALPPISSWELWTSLAERCRWTFSEILRDAITQ